MKTNKIPSAKIVLIVWLAFSVLYVGYNEYKRLKIFGLDRAYKSGLSDAVVRVIQQAQTCKPFPVRFEETGVQLISVECLTNQQGEQAPADSQ